MTQHLIRALKWTLPLAWAIVGAARTHAGHTSVNVAPPSELTHDKILSHVYGETITATRVDDAGGILAALGGDAASDQAWQNAHVTARALAKFSGYTQSFGIYEGETGGSFQHLLDVSGFGFDIDSPTASMDLSNKTWRWARNGNSGEQTSSNNDNLDLRDHMVTYRLDGAGNDDSITWVLFWEDMNLAPETSPWRSTSDFNDLVIEVQATPVATVISAPLPAPVWTGLATLLGGGLIRTARRYRVVQHLKHYVGFSRA